MCVRKAYVQSDCLIMFVHLFAWNNPTPTGWIFINCYICEFLLKFVSAFELKSDINSSFFTNTCICLCYWFM